MALLLAKRSFKVGVLDIDICGPSMANMLAISNKAITSTQWGWKPCESPHYGIKVMSVASLIDKKESAVIYKGPRKTNLIKRMLKETFWGKLDFLLIDTPPGTSDEHLTILRLLKNLNPDGAILVSTAQKFSLNTIRKEISFCHKMKLNIIGLVENMSYFECSCCGVTIIFFLLLLSFFLIDYILLNHKLFSFLINKKKLGTNLSVSVNRFQRALC